MVPHFRTIRSSNVWRLIYIVCMVLAFSYIFFDVLDLDGSDSASPWIPTERSIIVAEAQKDVDRLYLLVLARLLGYAPALFTASSGELIQPQRTEVYRSSPLDSARSRGYRSALPRSSPEDSSPSA
jgi:hypothetical protein